MLMLIRASIGTLAKLGIINMRMTEEPTTAYLLQYGSNGCLAKCAFCSQSISSSSSKILLSRISWPSVDLMDLISRPVNKLFRRICVQTILKEKFVDELLEIVRIIRKRIRIPVSVATTPLSRDILIKLRDMGIDYVGTGLDTLSPRIFKAVRKPYSWLKYENFVKEAINIFGSRRVIVHFIAGLGERPEEAYKSIFKFHMMGARIALFAFTPIKGTPMENYEKPDTLYYRSLQVLIWLLSKGVNVSDSLVISNSHLKFKEEALSLKGVENAFLTNGCPDCNRPFYNESPSGPYYNYPSRELLYKDRRWIKDLRGIMVDD